MAQPFSFNFGSSSTPSGSTGLFGSTAATQPSNQSAGLFGSSTTTTPSGTSFGFGKSATSTTTQPSTGLNTTFSGFGTKPGIFLLENLYFI